VREPRLEGRVVRKGLLESERWLTLKDNADRLAYLSLLLSCDDYGNYSGERYRLMRMWRDFGISSVELVAKTLNELQDHEMIGLYEHDGRPFVHVQRLFNTRQWWSRIFPQSPFEGDKDNPQKQRVTEKSINHVLAHHKPGVRGKGLGVVQNPYQSAEPPVNPAPAPAPPARSKPAPPTPGVDSELQKTCRATWHAYSDAYEFRHGAAPIRDARASSSIKRFCQSVPQSEAPDIARFFVQNSNSFYVQKMHPPTLLAQDSAKLRTEWATQHQMTQSEAMQADKKAGLQNVFTPLIYEAEQREKSSK
jgi:hypothetical protein